MIAASRMLLRSVQAVAGKPIASFVLSWIMR